MTDPITVIADILKPHFGEGDADAMSHTIRNELEGNGFVIIPAEELDRAETAIERVREERDKLARVDTVGVIREVLIERLTAALDEAGPEVQPPPDAAQSGPHVRWETARAEREADDDLT